MKPKNLQSLTLLLFIILCMNAKLQSQSHVIPAVRKYDYPLQSGTIVPDIVSNPGNIKSLPDSVFAPKGYQYIEFVAQFVLPYEPYLKSLFIQDNNTGLRSVLFKHLPGNKVAFIMDADGDGDFLEETVDTVPVNKPALIMRALMLTKDGQPCPFMLPLEIKMEYQEGTFKKMRIRNMLKYQINHPLGQDTLLVDIRAHQHRIQCYLYRGTAKDSTFRFQLNEPFLFKGHYYKLSNLDLCDNTVKLERLEAGKIRGYREGFYLDMAMLRQLTDMHMMKGSSIHWGERPYTLLHFWGEWCNPCRAETPELKALDEYLEASSKVRMIHYPFVMKKELLERTLSYIRENGLSPNQSLCIGGNCSLDEEIKEQCDVCSFARVSDFPKYILLDQQGKILFLNKQGGAEVAINKLKDLGLY